MDEEKQKQLLKSFSEKELIIALKTTVKEGRLGMHLLFLIEGLERCFNRLDDLDKNVFPDSYN